MGTLTSAKGKRGGVRYHVAYPGRRKMRGSSGCQSKSQWPSIALRNRATGMTKGVGDDGYEQENEQMVNLGDQKELGLHVEGLSLYIQAYKRS